jgi:uncharacterized protein YoxC
MDTFLVGFLSALVIILVIALVVGLVTIVKLFKRVKDLEVSVEDVYREISNVNDEIHRRIDGEMIEIEKTIESKTDSKINKLEDRLKK